MSKEPEQQQELEPMDEFHLPEDALIFDKSPLGKV